jgi:hypothetical protein
VAADEVDHVEAGDGLAFVLNGAKDLPSKSDEELSVAGGV